jgi:hypothetical protein
MTVFLLPAETHSQVSNGFVGVYADSLGVSPCTNIPPYTSATLYVLAKTEGESENGIIGAEFRIEVSDPAGWLVSFAPVASADVVLGNPIDTDPNPNAGGGVTLAFASCQQPDSAGTVQLGTMCLFNLNGNPLQLLVKRHSTPSSPIMECPHFVLCDSPSFSQVCMSTAPGDTCSVESQKSFSLSGGDPATFVATVNREGEGTVPGASDTLSAAAAAMRQRSIQRGFSEADLSWRTASEQKAWVRSMPTWMKKISIRVLDRARLLEEKNMLVHDRRHLAPEYSTRHLPVDDQARIQVSVIVTDVSSLDEQVIESLGGTLVTSSPTMRKILCWIPPEQLQSLAERPEVEKISYISVAVGNTVTSEGDQFHNAETLRNTSQLRGLGQKIGVIARGAENYATAELPSVEYDATVGLGDGDEGTAILEIIHDLAPDASLAFARATKDAEFETAVNYLKGVGVSVIVDDLSFPEEPLFQEDPANAPLAEIRRQAVLQNDIFYVIAAGNDRLEHYDGWYTPAGVGCLTDKCSNKQINGRAHEFAPQEDKLRVYLGEGRHEKRHGYNRLWAPPRRPTTHESL